MDFFNEYRVTRMWSNKAIIMELYHLTQVATVPKWTITHTAIYFECSLGLVSENLRLAHTIHTHPSIIECATREDALKQMRKYGTLQQSKVAKA